MNARSLEIHCRSDIVTEEVASFIVVAIPPKEALALTQ
jgi:hypothetical protein